MVIDIFYLKIMYKILLGHAARFRTKMVGKLILSFKLTAQPFLEDKERILVASMKFYTADLAYFGTSFSPCRLVNIFVVTT